MSKEQVNHPEHYGGKDNPYETIKIIDAMGWGKEFCLGNVIKYVTRAGKKDNNSSKQDLNKAKWYLEHAIELLESNINKNMGNNINDSIKVRESKDDKVIAKVAIQELDIPNKNMRVYKEREYDDLYINYPIIKDTKRKLIIPSEEPVFSLKENEVIKILENISDITPKFKDKVTELLKSESDSSLFFF